jgi:hypothetical protein
MSSFLRSLGFTLALSAMLVRALLPAGWMPNPAGPGETVLVICTAQGLVKLAPVHDRHRAPLSDHGGQACPFGAATPLSPPQLAALAPAPVGNGQWFSFTSVRFFAVTSHRGFLHAPRAPPVLA